MPDPQMAYYAAALPPQISCDIKPRLTKEQHDILEAHYQKQSKPNTNTKKGFAESLNVSLDKVNVSRRISSSLLTLHEANHARPELVSEPPRQVEAGC